MQLGVCLAVCDSVGQWLEIYGILRREKIVLARGGT